MEILDTLRFVQGAVSTKDFVPEMKHFVIKDGTIRAFNGVIALSSPIEFDIDCAPKATHLVQAIRNCSDVTTLGMTEANRLRIKSGPFRAFIDCVDMEGLADHQPVGQVIDIDGQALLDAIKVLTPFVGNDASRQWVNGILFRGQSAFACNNVCLIEYWIGAQLPFEANVPMQAIKEVVRIGTPPIQIQVSDHSLTFRYPDGRWIRTQLFTQSWPENFTDKLAIRCEPKAIPENMFDGMETIKPFLEAQALVFFRDGMLCTHGTDGLGATYEVAGLPERGIYKHVMLSLLKGVAKSADFDLYPNPVMFYGDRVRGAIMGLIV